MAISVKSFHGITMIMKTIKNYYNAMLLYEIDYYKSK